MNQVEAVGVTKRYGRTVALDGVGLTLGVGVTGLLGPNAAGKTTLLRILSTALEPDEGDLDVLGNDPATSAGRQSIRGRLGYLPQELSLPRGFTTFGFVDYLAILKDWNDRDSRHAEVRRVIDLVGLTDVAARRLQALSGGQRRRVVIAQALLGRPRLLVLDEPTTGLDPAQRALLRDVLSEAGRAAVVLLSTHQTEDVAALCERVIVLADGRVRHDGPVDRFVASAAGHVWHAAERDPRARHAWRTGGGTWRHVGDPPPGARPAEPSLEDAYLLLVGDLAVAGAATSA